MDLSLNVPHQIYEGFEGRYVDQMQRLVASGAQPLSVADIMRKRLEVYHSTPGAVRDQLVQGWFDNYFDTVDGIAYHGDKAKITLKSPLLLGITPQSPLKDGALIITPEIYGSLAGAEFTREQLEKAGINARLTKSRVVAHPGWQALVVGDNHILQEYADVLFSLVKEKYQEDTAMGFYVTGEEGSSLRSWVLGGRGGRLDGGGGRLVGVRAVASEASAPQSEQVDAVAAYRSRVLTQIAMLQNAPLQNVATELAALETIVRGQ